MGGAGGVRALHQLLLGTVGAQDVGAVGDEAASHQAGLAAGTDKAIVMPVPILERNEASAANACAKRERERGRVSQLFYRAAQFLRLTCNGLHTRGATLGEQLAKALGTVGLLVAASEPLPGQRDVAVGAREALAMPRFIFIGHAPRGDDLSSQSREDQLVAVQLSSVHSSLAHLVALDAARGKLLLVAAGAVDLLLTRYERLRANGHLADAAAEAVLVPLPGFVFHFLGACNRPNQFSLIATLNFSAYR